MTSPTFEYLEIVDADAPRELVQLSPGLHEVLEIGVPGPIGPVGPMGPSYYDGGALAMQDAPLSGARTVGFWVEHDCGDSGAALTIRLADAQKQKVRLTTSNPTLTIDPTGAGVGNYQIRIIQDATGNRQPSFPGLSASRWLGSANQPAINAAANGESLLSLFWDGTQFIQSLAKVGAS